jgi:hypothetical protein
MSPDRFALAVAVALFASGLIGVVLQRALHESFTTGGPRDMIGAIVGLLTLLSALTLGLLIWTAYGVYIGQNTTIQTLAAKVLQLDLALADWGRAQNKTGDQPHALGYAPGAEMPREIEAEREAMPVPSRERA